MKRFLPSYFEELKKRVLEKVGIKDICPSDCYRIAVDISSSTQKRISETTLKRIYGFAASRYTPSSFTLNAMADFCGFEGWSGYVDHMESFQMSSTSSRSWEMVAQTAHKITRFTLETNKQKCGIPYEHSINRAGLIRHIDFFEKSKANVCLVSGQAGSGKTTGLTRWVDHQLTGVSKGQQQDIYLFINSYSLLQVAGHGYDGGRWLAQILNMQKEGAMHDFLKAYKNESPGNFYLIIDDLNSNFFNDKHFGLIINQLIDMSAYFASFGWFKFILSMRPTTWQLYKHLIEGSKAIYKNWYTGFNIHTAHDAINLLPFSLDEIYQLNYNITGKDDAPSEEFRKQHSFIKLPLYFQYYYQLKGKSIDPATLTMADQFAIAGPYINKHVLKGSRNTEKQLLTHQLFNQAYYHDGNICINKENAYHLIKQHHTSYREMLQSGIFYEYHTESQYRNVTEVRVQSALLGAYFISKNLLSNNSYAINDRLLAALKYSAYPDHIRILILKWFIVFSLESGNMDFINELTKNGFSTFEEHLFTVFICNCLNNASLQNVEINFRINDQLNASSFIERAVLYPGLQSSYVKALKQLLRFSLNDKNRIYIHSKLGLIAVLQLNNAETAEQIEALRELKSPAFASMPLNPLHGLEALHHYLRYGTVNLEALYELTRFYFHPAAYEAPQNELFLSIALYCSLLANNPRKSIRLIHAIHCNIIQNPDAPVTHDFLITSNLFQCLEWLRSGKKEKAARVLGDTDKDHTHTFNQVAQKLLKQFTDSKPQEDIFSHVNHLLSIAIFEEITLVEVFIRMFLIKVDSSLSDQALKEHKTAIKQAMKQSHYLLESLAGWEFPFNGVERQLTEKVKLS